LLVPVGFFLLLLQGISELIKNIAMLRGDLPDVTPEHEPTAASILQEQEPQ
jgi:TRAP-type mannitol/chloroaromatic compound transport system permease small subunit